MIKEIDIQNAILAYLNMRGIYCWRNNTVGIFDSKKGVYRKPMGKYQINGISDILGILKDGRMLCVECKSEKGKLTEAQKDFLENINSNGGVAFVARSIDDVKNKLAGLTLS